MKTILIRFAATIVLMMTMILPQVHAQSHLREAFYSNLITVRNFYQSQLRQDNGITVMVAGGSLMAGAALAVNRMHYAPTPGVLARSLIQMSWVLGVVLIVDDVIYQTTEVSPLTVLLNHTIRSRYAYAATLTDAAREARSSVEGFRNFLNKDLSEAVALMEVDPVLAKSIEIMAQGVATSGSADFDGSP